MPEEFITKEEYDAIREQEIADSNLDVYDIVETQDDADDIILDLNIEYADDDLMYQDDPDEIAYSYDPNRNYIYESVDGSKYINKDAPIADTTKKSSKSTNSSSDPKTGPSYSGTGVSVGCSDIVSNFSRDLKIKGSTYGTIFTLGELSGNNFGRLQDKTVKGKYYTKYQIACNLKALGVNVLDKIKHQFPDMVINSTIRNWGTNSEHETGQAADLLFPKHKKKDYIIIINWIHSNCPWNQLFLEYRPKSNPRGGWIHVSYEQPGNQVYGANKAASTLYNDSSAAPGAAGRFVNVMSHCDWT